jgi:transposase InsO family protein
MTPAQKATVRRALEKAIEKFGPLVGHGDCVGADAEFDEIAAELGCVRRLYPSNLEQTRAHCELRGAIEFANSAPPLTRNGWIVNASSVLIATPKEYREELRSGTWSTIRRARKRSVTIPLVIVLPSGSLFL